MCWSSFPWSQTSMFLCFLDSEKLLLLILITLFSFCFFHPMCNTQHSRKTRVHECVPPQPTTAPRNETCRNASLHLCIPSSVPPAISPCRLVVHYLTTREKKGGNRHELSAPPPQIRTPPNPLLGYYLEAALKRHIRPTETG